MMLETREEIEEWLIKMRIKNYKINKDLTVDVADSVNIDGKKLTEIPVQFGKVKQHFCCYYNQLTSCRGFPKEVGWSLKAYGNRIYSLEHAPEKVGGSIFIGGNNLSELRNTIKHVGEIIKFDNIDELSNFYFEGTETGQAKLSEINAYYENLDLYNKIHESSEEKVASTLNKKMKI